MSAAEPLAHLYALALRALDEQERRAEALRARLGPVLAAAGLGASLLGGPVLGGAHPHGVVGTLAIGLALVGFVSMLAGATYVLGSRHRVAFDPDLRRLVVALDREDLLDDASAFHRAMITRLGDARVRNIRTIDHLDAVFTAMLCGILAMLCGLAIAAIVG